MTDLKWLNEQYLGKTDQVVPYDEFPLCPACNKIDVVVEKLENKYPYFRCISCGAGFYKIEYRSFCGFIKDSVSQQQCKGCKKFHRFIKCTYWNGVIEPPKEVKDEIKRIMKNRGKTNVR